MVLPAGSVLRLYWPERCSATPHDEMAPVQDVSLVGLPFWASGSGCAVLMIQSALPAVSALELSNSTRCAAAALAAPAPVCAVAKPAATMATTSNARLNTFASGVLRVVRIGASL